MKRKTALLHYLLLLLRFSVAQQGEQDNNVQQQQRDTAEWVEGAECQAADSKV